MSVIRTTSVLNSVTAKLKEAPCVAVDTEFVGENTFWPRLCLIQLASSPSEGYLVDPLSKDLDLSPLGDLMGSPEVVKIFHAAKQDLSILTRALGVAPQPIFDTQIAASFCGLGEQIGYADLVKTLLSLTLDKGARMADWSSRPLTQECTTYALQDVLHLCPLYEKLLKALKKANRLSWHEDEQKKLFLPSETPWRRLYHRGLNPSMLKELSLWRDHEAMKRDCPRKHVLTDQALSRIADRCPSTLSALHPLVPSHLPQPARSSLLACVLKGLKETTESSEEHTQPSFRTLQATGLLKLLLKNVCHQHKVSPSTLASTKDLEKFAAYPSSSAPFLTGWRYDLFGRQALALMEGNLALTLGPSRVESLPINTSKKDKSVSDQH